MTDIDNDDTGTTVLSIMGTTKIGELELRHCVTLPRSAAVKAAIEAMAANRQGAVAIVDRDDRLVGIFTERDVLLLGMSGMPGWQDQPVGRVATTRPVTVRQNESVVDMIGKLHAGQFRHLPVVDEDGRPQEMASVRDVLAYVAELFPRELVNLPPEPPLESRGPWGG